MDETDVYVDMESRVYVVRPKQELQRRPSLLRVPGVYALATTRAGLSRSESAAAVGSSDQVCATMRHPVPVLHTPLLRRCTHAACR